MRPITSPRVRNIEDSGVSHSVTEIQLNFTCKRYSVKLFQERSFVVKFSRITDNPGCKVLDRLQLEEVGVRCIGPDGGTIKQLTKHIVKIKTNFSTFSYLWIKCDFKSNEPYDFRPKLHDPKFNCHFIRSILKSHNLIAKICQTMAFVVFHFPAMWLVSLKKP